MNYLQRKISWYLISTISKARSDADASENLDLSNWRFPFILISIKYDKFQSHMIHIIQTQDETQILQLKLKFNCELFPT